MRWLRLNTRIRALETAVAVRSGRECNCRYNQETSYHSAAELAQIMEIRCPMHEVRDLGHLRWVPSGLPLRTEDREFCSCPPFAIREFLQGSRGPLTQEEQEEACRVWDEQFTEQADQSFHADQVHVRLLLQKYERGKRRTNAISSALPRQNKRREIL